MKPHRNRDPAVHGSAAGERLIAMTIEERLEQIEQTLQSLVGQRAAKEWYTTAEAAEILGRAEFTVREWCRLGRVNAEKRRSSKEWIISHEELERVQNHGLLPEVCRFRRGK